MKLDRWMRTALILPLLMVFPVAVGSAQQLKIGIVNKAEILEQSAEFTEAQRKFNAQKEKWDQELEQMQAEIRKKETSYQRQQEDLKKQWGSMVDEAKQKAQTELQTAEGDIGNLYQRLNTFYQEIYAPPAGKLQQLENELAEPIRIKLEEVINRIGKAEGFHLIIDNGPTSDVLFASGLVSLNSRVVEELNKDFKGGQAKD